MIERWSRFGSRSKDNEVKFIRCIQSFLDDVLRKKLAIELTPKGLFARKNIPDSHTLGVCSVFIQNDFLKCIAEYKKRAS